MNQVLLVWLCMTLIIGVPCLLAWVHRSWLKGMIILMIMGVAFFPTVYIVMIPMALFANMLSGFFPEALREGVIAGIGTVGTGLLMSTLFVCYCVNERQTSGFKSAPANAYRSSRNECGNPLVKRAL